MQRRHATGAEPPGAVRRHRARARGRSPTSAAIGEMGLDYHYDSRHAGLAASVFSAQVRLARTRQLAVHRTPGKPTRTPSGSSRMPARAKVRGVFHCFTGNVALARRRSSSASPVAFGHRVVPEVGRPRRGRRDRARPTGCSSKPTVLTSRRCRIAASGTSPPSSSTWRGALCRGAATARRDRRADQRRTSQRSSTSKWRELVGRSSAYAR